MRQVEVVMRFPSIGMPRTALKGNRPTRKPCTGDFIESLAAFSGDMHCEQQVNNVFEARDQQRVHEYPLTDP